MPLIRCFAIAIGIAILEHTLQIQVYLPPVRKMRHKAQREWTMPKIAGKTEGGGNGVGGESHLASS
uniref:LD19629p n=1 Tax=Drosophila melanogaster TaxID=7227 RepID=Q95RM8_DROME|nr:LD19629p [Drosophila melanogaster]